MSRKCNHWYTCDRNGLIFCEKCNRSFTYGDANYLEARVEELERKLRLYETATSYPRYE